MPHAICGDPPPVICRRGLVPMGKVALAARRASWPRPVAWV